MRKGKSNLRGIKGTSIRECAITLYRDDARSDYGVHLPQKTKEFLSEEYNRLKRTHGTSLRDIAAEASKQMRVPISYSKVWRIIQGDVGKGSSQFDTKAFHGICAAFNIEPIVAFRQYDASEYDNADDASETVHQ